MSVYPSNLWSIPLLVVIPILVAVLVNFVYNRARLIKVISVVSAVCLAVISLISSYGYHWFTGQPALRPETLTFTFDPGFPAWR
ncbi:MAG: hypothetical protein QXO54_04585, partial [Candidatus Methanomethylicaceae archaeon]